MRAILLVSLAVAFAVCAPATAVEVSVKNNIGGHFEYAGFTIVPAEGAYVPPQAGDLSAPKAFEILRPGQQAFSIGRLFTSCTCFQLATDKKVYMAGERAFIALRNVQPTKGQDYPFYVQITGPISVALRHDTFIISDQFVGTPEAQTPGKPEAQTPGKPEAVTEPEAAPEVAAETAPVAEETVPAEAPAPAAETGIAEVFQDDVAEPVVPEDLPQGKDEYLSDDDLQGN